MDQKTQSIFLNKDCTIFKLNLNEISLFSLILNVNEIGKNLIEMFKNAEGNKLTFSEIDENSFLLEDFNLDSTDDNLEIIKVLFKDTWTDKYAYLVNKDGHVIINFNLDEIDVLEERVKIIGVFLNEKDKLLELLMNKEEEIKLNEFNFEMNDRISGLFFDDEEEEITKEIELEDDEEEENFDKEFESEEAILEDEDEIEKKTKKHKKKRNEEDENLNEEFIGKEKKKKRRRDEIDESKYIDNVTVFLAKLREAIELDKQVSRESDKPALEKLKILPYLTKFLANVSYQNIFLQSNGLELLQEWIKKSPDGTYPALNQISQMLDILSSLNLSVYNLKSCQIGGYIMDLSKNMKESKPIMRKAKNLVEKWTRIVLDINTNYSDIHSENKLYEKIYNRSKRSRSDQDSDDSKENIESTEQIELKKEYDIYSHAKIPRKALFDFVKKPVSNINESKMDQLARLKTNPFLKRKTVGRKKGE